MRIVAGCASLYLRGRVLEHKRSLLIRVALYTCLIDAGGQPDLFLLESAVLIVTIRAFHDAFEHAMMERLEELGSGLIVAGNAELRLRLHQQHMGRLVSRSGRQTPG
jgi:hypothetical protein